MDAVKFIKERQRMCKHYKDGCVGCPLDDGPCGGYRDVDAERVVGAVEEWSAAHPCKTRQSVFLEQWPEAAADREGLLVVCPKNLNVNFSCIDESTDTRSFKACPNCRREFWMQEVE